MSKRYLYTIAFFSGMTTLAIELSASRLLGNVFGNSNLVWANVIGLMLLYLTVGYFAGGRLADKMPRAAVMLQIILWAAFLSALIPLLARPIISRAADAVFGAEAALALGSFIVILVLFSSTGDLAGHGIAICHSSGRDRSGEERPSRGSSIRHQHAGQLVRHLSPGADHNPADWHRADLSTVFWSPFRDCFLRAAAHKAPEGFDIPCHACHCHYSGADRA